LRINTIIDKFDDLVQQDNTKAINTFKAVFSLESLTNDRDFAVTIAFPIGGPMNYPTKNLARTRLGHITTIDTALSQYTGPMPGLGSHAIYVRNVVNPIWTRFLFLKKNSTTTATRQRI